MGVSHFQTGGTRTSKPYKTRFLNPQRLPFVVEPLPGDDHVFQSISRLFEECRDQFQAAMLKYGAILFRNFHITSTAEFHDLVRRFSGKDLLGYAGGVSPRIRLSDGVYTSTEYPENLRLTLHNELSYSGSFPSHLYFFCITPPQIGGETTLGDSRRILKRISPEIKESFAQKGVLYKRNLSSETADGYSWQAAFETDDPKAVEEICIRNQMNYCRRAGHSLHLEHKGPAILTHLVTNEEVWFNQAEGFHPSALDQETYYRGIRNNGNFRLNSQFGDGHEIPVDMLTSIRSVLEREAIPHRWQRNDLLILDNVLTAHGRTPYSGPRKIALCMT